MHDRSYDELEKELGPAERPPREANLLMLRLFFNVEGVFLERKFVPPQDIAELAGVLNIPMPLYETAYQLLQTDYEYLLSLLTEDENYVGTNRDSTKRNTISGC